MKDKILMQVMSGATALVATFDSTLSLGEQQCPAYLCDPKHVGGALNMDDQVICFKQDVINPFEFKFKTCPDGQFCHGGLNRCAMDPYARVVERNPGNTCTQHYECKSKHCSMQAGVCSVPDKITKMSCSEHSQCNVGYYCADAAMKDFQLADPTRQPGAFMGICTPQRG